MKIIEISNFERLEVSVNGGSTTIKNISDMSGECEVFFPTSAIRDIVDYIEDTKVLGKKMDKLLLSLTDEEKDVLADKLNGDE